MHKDFDPFTSGNFRSQGGKEVSNLLKKLFRFCCGFAQKGNFIPFFSCIRDADTILTTDVLDVFELLMGVDLRS